MPEIHYERNGEVVEMYRDDYTMHSNRVVAWNEPMKNKVTIPLTRIVEIHH
jgi:hypothetical protein